MQHYHIPPDFITLTDDFTYSSTGDLSFPAQAGFQCATRVGFYFLLFVKSGSGRYSQNQYNVELGPGAVCLGVPGDIVQFHFTDMQELHLIRLTESFLMKNTHAGIMEEFPFLQSEGLPPLQLDKQEFAELERLYDQIRSVYLSHAPLRKKRIAYLLLLVLLKFKEKLFHDEHALSCPGRQTDIVSHFKAMLRKHYQDLYSGEAEKVCGVKEYADALGMHPNYLNYIIRVKTGKPVSKWIIDKTISESKLLLAYSGLTIKEIAYRLGFMEASYFCRYFKRYTNVTPVEYRKNCGHTAMLKEMGKPVLTAQSFMV